MVEDKREPQRARSRSRRRATVDAGVGEGGAPLPPRTSRPAHPSSSEAAATNEPRPYPGHPAATPVEPGITGTSSARDVTARPVDVASPLTAGAAYPTSESITSSHRQEASVNRPSRPETRTPLPPRRSPSAPANIHEATEDLTPRSALDHDTVSLAELARFKVLSHDALQHLAMYLNDRRKHMEESQSATATKSKTPRRPRSADEAVDPDLAATPKRPCVLQARLRDPRIRPRNIPGPPQAASAAAAGSSAAAATPRNPASFADALRAPAPGVAARPAASSLNSTVAAPPDASSQPSKKLNLPPLIAEVLPNWASHFVNIRNLLGHAPNARPYKQGVRFSPDSVDEYRVIQKYLANLDAQEDDLSWFCFNLPSERSKKVAIRGLPATTTPEEIRDALGALGYTVEYARRIQARRGRPGCIFFAILASTPDLLPGIYGVSELLNIPGVIIEAWRSRKGPAQCHRCQAFRHSSHGCHRRLACVRCGEHHFARDCIRPRDVPTTCVNCGGPHPANYSKCPAYKRELRSIKAANMALSQIDRSRPANLHAGPPTNTIATEYQATNLMAPANPPTERGRRLRKRGGRGRGRNSNRDSNRQPLEGAFTEQAPLSTNAPLNTALPPARVLRGATLPATQTDQRATARSARIDVDKVLDIYKDIIVALRAGEDPTKAVLDGMMLVLKCNQKN